MNLKKRMMAKDLAEINDRKNVAAWLTKRNMLGKVAEIGVMHGGFSKIVLSEWKGETYYMVDIWERQSSEVYKEKTDDVPYDLKYLDCLKIADEYPCVRIIKDYSVSAANQIPDGSLDWVFIDANHSFQAVTDDMNAWYPKLRSGGLFSGHDYGDETTPPHWCEVKSAVLQWMVDRGMVFSVTPCSSWWTIKP